MTAGHDDECEADWVDIAYSYSPCGCAERAQRRAAEEADDELRASDPNAPWCPFAGRPCDSGCPDVEHRTCVDGP